MYQQKLESEITRMIKFFEFTGSVQWEDQIVLIDSNRNIEKFFERRSMFLFNWIKIVVKRTKIFEFPGEVGKMVWTFK